MSTAVRSLLILEDRVVELEKARVIQMEIISELISRIENLQVRIDL